MNDSPSYHIPDNQSKPKGGPNWWIIGGLAVLLTLLLGVVGIAIGAKTWAKNTVEKFTTVGPMKLPALTTTDEDWRALQQRLHAFKKLVDSGEPAQLELTGDDLNDLIQRSPKHGQFKDLVWLEIKGDQITGQLSVPLKGIKAPMLKNLLEGRWLNGVASFYLGLSNGKASLHINDLTVNDNALPAQFLTHFKQRNLLENSYKDQGFRDLVSKFESIAVEDGKLKIAVKPDAFTKEKAEAMERNLLDAKPKGDLKPDQ